MACLSPRKIYLIEPVIFLYFLFSSGSSPLQGQFVRKRLIKDAVITEMNNETCSHDHSHINPNQLDAEASLILMYMNIAAILPAFLSTIMLGGYSDKMGRSIVLVLPLSGAFLRLSILILTAYFNLGTFFLILSSFVDGVCGMSCMMLMACFSYLSDVTNCENRSIRVVILEITAHVGTIISHLVIGYLIASIGFLSTFVVLLAIVCVNLIYVVFILAESKIIDDQHEHKLLTFDSFVDAFTVYFKRDEFNMRLPRLFCLLGMFMVNFVQIGQSDVQTLFMLLYPLCFESVWIGYFNAILYTITGFSNFVFTKLFSNILGDVSLMLVGSVFGIGLDLMFGFASSKTTLFLSCITGCGAFLIIPMIRSYSSKIVPSNKTGIMYSTLAIMQLLGILIGGICQNSIFSASVGTMSNLVFLIDASLYFLIALFIIFFIVYMKTCHSRIQTEDEQQIIT